MKQENIKLLYIDLFCGAGGTSTGVESAKTNGERCAKVIACVNHDANAIASHAANHPEALHYTEDIRTLNLDKLIVHLNYQKSRYPEALVVLWASLECTNFSKAKGGMPRDADSRTLAEHLFRYINALDPDYIQIENVEEFMSWGDLDEKGKPISRTNGIHYHRWIDRVQHAYGKHADKMHKDDYDKWYAIMRKAKSIKKKYNFDYRILNSADFGAYTSRKRFFGIFAKNDLPIVFPNPTHSKNGNSELFGSLKKWKAVKHCLDFEQEGQSIFNRKKPLVEATLARLMAGLVKFVAGGKDKWMLKYNSVNGNTGKHNPPGVDEPCPTIAVQSRLGIVQTKSISQYLLQYNKGTDRVKSIDEPCNTVTTFNRFGLVQPKFISKYFSGHPDSKNYSIEGPAHTITPRDHNSLVDVSFLSSYYGNGSNTSIEVPSPTVTTKDRLSLIKPIYFLDMQYGNGTPTNINKPAATVTTNPKHQIVECKSWLMNTNFNNVDSSLQQPSPTITADRHWHYLMNPQFSSAGGSIENPCFTLIAHMDKMPPYLIEASQSLDYIPPFIKVYQDVIVYEIYEDDTSNMKAIKEFMAHYLIVDIKMRMLLIPELKKIMGFPSDYKLIGTQADQKKFIGNAVEVTMARKMCEATVEEINELIILAV